jgi:hypothetical protein
MDAADLRSLNLTFYVHPNQGNGGGKGRVEFWLVNPCNEAIKLTGPVCTNTSGTSSDDGCSQKGLFSPVFEFGEVCNGGYPQWNNNLIVNNTGVQEQFAPYAGTSGQIILGNLTVTAYESVSDFTCDMINGNWYIFGRKQNPASGSIKILQACLQTCPQAYTKVLKATDECGLSSQAVQYLVREDECTDCGGGEVWFVDGDAVGINNGKSWQDAFADLQDALANATSGDQIWVAEGTYTPGNSRTSTFRPGSGVYMYGGFAGNETEIGQRNIATYPTILSGEIGAPGHEDNCYHVMTIADCVYDAYVNGFTLKLGCANGAIPYSDCGGGVLCFGELDLVLSEITQCYSVAAGSAIYNIGANANLLIEDCNLMSNDVLTNIPVLNIDGARMTVKNTNHIQE